jgi:hypothetical protein
MKGYTSRAIQIRSDSQDLKREVIHGDLIYIVRFSLRGPDLSCEAIFLLLITTVYPRMDDEEASSLSSHPTRQHKHGRGGAMVRSPQARPQRPKLNAIGC